MDNINKFLNLFLFRLSLPLNIFYKKFQNIIPFPLYKIFNLKVIEYTLVILLFVLVFISYFIPKNSIKHTTLQVSYFPYSAINRLDLSKIYWQNSSLNKANLEFNNALKITQNKLLFNNNKDSLFELSSNMKLQLEKPALLEQEIINLEKLLNTNVNSRDIYLRLSLLYFELWNERQSQDYWQKAYYLDPNNKEVLEVGKLIGIN